MIANQALLLLMINVTASDVLQREYGMPWPTKELHLQKIKIISMVVIISISIGIVSELAHEPPLNIFMG